MSLGWDYGWVGYRATRPGDVTVRGTSAPCFPPAPDVAGFDDTTVGTVFDTVIAGLPTGVAVPGVMLDIISVAAQIDSWLELGRIAKGWADDRGCAEASWVGGDDELAIPAELAGVEAPPAVQAFVAGGARVEELLSVLLHPR